MLNTLMEQNTKMQLSIENEIKPQLKLLAEGFQGYTEKLPAIDKAINDIEDIRLDMEIVKAVVTKQSRDISKLQIIK